MLFAQLHNAGRNLASMKALPRRKGNRAKAPSSSRTSTASMKALPRRKGNTVAGMSTACVILSLNESPS